MPFIFLIELATKIVWKDEITLTPRLRMQLSGRDMHLHSIFKTPSFIPCIIFLKWFIWKEMIQTALFID
jgi:hypothetical protein